MNIGFSRRIYPAVLVSTGILAAAQEPILRTTTHAVVLDITVLDRHGNPISGLKRDDFVVTEDGVPQLSLPLRPQTLLPYQPPRRPPVREKLRPCRPSSSSTN
jgi:hypothetical protein